jgi:hypothetical protein
MKDLKEITDGDVIEIAKLIKTNNWDNTGETTYWNKFYNEPFYEMYGHAKSYIINSIYFQIEVWQYLKDNMYNVPEFIERPK